MAQADCVTEFVRDHVLRSIRTGRHVGQIASYHQESLQIPDRISGERGISHIGHRHENYAVYYANAIKSMKPLRSKFTFRDIFDGMPDLPQPKRTTEIREHGIPERDDFICDRQSWIIRR